LRYALAVEYNGGGFCGWQRQPHCHSVQEELEQALTQIAQTPITVHCAGRTDTGVHAHAQIVHFDTDVSRPLTAWSFGVNSHLDKRVAVRWASPVSEDFHARFSALNRSYRYTLLNRATRPGVRSGMIGWERVQLDTERMHLCAQSLIGEQDFSSFRSSECQADHAIREVQAVSVTREGDEVHIDIRANGFLHNMVRIITGCLVAVGRGEQSEQWIAELLTAKDRTLAGVTVSPHGLYFVQPQYPAEFGIPDFRDTNKAPWHP